MIYLFKNPERAGLVENWMDWPYHGSILPGYPELPQTGLGDFWPVFWKIHNRERTRHSGCGEEL